MAGWHDTLFEMIERTACDLPEDVEVAIRRGLEAEVGDSNAARALGTILENIQLARQTRRPLCQDTGTVLFWVNAPYATLSQRVFGEAARDAIARAVHRGILRPNAVDPLSGRNTGTTFGPGYPVVHWEESENSVVSVSLLLKGGGSENVSEQFSLPCGELRAGRDLDGVRRCVLRAVQLAQGKGCAPGIVGIAVGGDRATGFLESKRQLLRPLQVRSEVPELAALEERILADAKSLNVGPMGFGGNTTLLGVAATSLFRVPASYFVSVAYMCWACRRYSVQATPDGRILAWLF
jgi:fumarate hydratase, class I